MQMLVFYLKVQNYWQNDSLFVVWIYKKYLSLRRNSAGYDLAIAIHFHTTTGRWPKPLQG